MADHHDRTFEATLERNLTAIRNQIHRLVAHTDVQSSLIYTRVKETLARFDAGMPLEKTHHAPSERLADALEKLDARLEHVSRTVDIIESNVRSLAERMEQRAES